MRRRHRPRHSISAALLIALVSGARPASAAATAIPPALEAIAQKTRAIRSLEVTMKQTKEMSVFRQSVVSHGTLVFVRPRRLRMDLGPPAQTTLIISGDEMVMHYAALDKTERTNLARDPRARAVAEHLFMLLDADPNALADVYSLELLGDSPVRVRLTPKPEALKRLISRVEARFDARGFVDHMVLVESNGDRTTWDFSQPRINQPIADTRFSLP